MDDREFVVLIVLTVVVGGIILWEVSKRFLKWFIESRMYYCRRCFSGGIVFFKKYCECCGGHLVAAAKCPGCRARYIPSCRETYCGCCGTHLPSGNPTPPLHRRLGEYSDN